MHMMKGRQSSDLHQLMHAVFRMLICCWIPEENSVTLALQCQYPNMLKAEMVLIFVDHL